MNARNKFIAQNAAFIAAVVAGVAALYFAIAAITVYVYLAGVGHQGWRDRDDDLSGGGGVSAVQLGHSHAWPGGVSVRLLWVLHRCRGLAQGIALLGW